MLTTFASGRLEEASALLGGLRPSAVTLAAGASSQQFLPSHLLLAHISGQERAASGGGCCWLRLQYARAAQAPPAGESLSLPEAASSKGPGWWRQLNACCT